jgi:hypothetical protein
MDSNTTNSNSQSSFRNTDSDYFTSGSSSQGFKGGDINREFLENFYQIPKLSKED